MRNDRPAGHEYSSNRPPRLGNEGRSRPRRKPDQQSRSGRNSAEGHRAYSSHGSNARSRRGASGGPPGSPIDTASRKEQKRLRRNARQRRARRKKTEATWYTVVRGRRVGLFPRWEEVKAATDNYHDQKAYAHTTRIAALECWMRHYNGVRIHAKNTTMASRGEARLRSVDYHAEGVQ